jgi:hypothetical protein
LNHRKARYQKPGSKTQEHVHAANVICIVVSYNGHSRVLRYATLTSER